MKHTILRDNREQLPWEFASFDVKIRDETLNTGDYTMAELSAHDEGTDTYHPNYAVERKSGSDFIRSITRDRERFKREIKRAAEWESPILVIVEEPREPSRYQDTWYKPYDMSREQIFGTIEKWERYYNVSFRFAGNRERAQRIAHDCLTTRLRASLMG